MELGWSGVVGLERVMGGEEVKSGWIGFGCDCDWAIVCGVCYYPKLL